jgi:hypothetical protein
MAGAEYADRSPGRETALGVLHVSPRSIEHETMRPIQTPPET